MAALCGMISLEFLLYCPQFWQTALNSGKVTKPLKMVNFDGQKNEYGARKKEPFPESILTCAFCKKRGPNWSNFASVAPFVLYTRIQGVTTLYLFECRGDGGAITIRAMPKYFCVNFIGSSLRNTGQVWP